MYGARQPTREQFFSTESTSMCNKITATFWTLQAAQSSDVVLGSPKMIGTLFSRSTISLVVSRCTPSALTKRTYEKKNHQVRRIGEFYANADSILEWFGKSPKIEQLLWDAMPSPQPPSVGSFAPMRPFNVYNILAVGALCKEEYWTRAWITQETTLAKELTYVAGYSAVHHAKMFQSVKAI